MHQQVRCSIRRADAAFGRPDEESLVEILTLLQAMSLRSAGRVRPGDGGGEKFAFSVVHPPGDDTADQEACNILLGAGFEAKVFQVEHRDLVHQGGTLLEAINEVEEKWGEPVIEVYVGAAEPGGEIPVQLVTRKMLKPRTP
jgi:hypothetical protein